MGLDPPLEPAPHVAADHACHLREAAKGSSLPASQGGAPLTTPSRSPSRSRCVRPRPTYPCSSRGAFTPLDVCEAQKKRCVCQWATSPHLFIHVGCTVVDVRQQRQLNKVHAAAQRPGARVGGNVLQRVAFMRTPF